MYVSQSARWRPAALLLLVVAFGFGLTLALRPQPVVRAAVVPAVTSAPTLDDPDRVCAGCHRTIYERYEKTAMARGSGLAAAAFTPGSFSHAASGVTYRVFERDGADWMSFERPASSQQGALLGEHRLEFFIGSGEHGRTYLYKQAGQWFELPINFYTRRNAYGMAPAFDGATAMPAALPVDPNCLHCHVSELQPALATARSRYATVPFRQGGVGCAACHGDPAAHLAMGGHGPIVNPDHLPPTQRDSACIQCHLEGNAVVYQPGKSLAQFKPGDPLSDFAMYFVRASQVDGGARATSQYEALLQSACKRASGDKLTCTTCHDPHFSPAPVERVAYFRARCLSCHSSPAIAVRHHPEQPDCALCHMPSRPTTDISHEQAVDHNIEARPRPWTAGSEPLLRSLSVATASETASEQLRLVPVGDSKADDRALGLAYAQVALKGDASAAVTALRLLNSAAAKGSNDMEFEVRYGYLLQTHGQQAKARAAYTAALQTNPWEPTALANLAVLDASNSRVPEALHLLDRLLDADPSQTAAGLDLAFIDCSVGRGQQAAEVMRRLIAINPDDPQLRVYLTTGRYAGQRCDVQGVGSRK